MHKIQSTWFVRKYTPPYTYFENIVKILNYQKYRLKIITVSLLRLWVSVLRGRASLRGDSASSGLLLESSSVCIAVNDCSSQVAAKVCKIYFI